MKGDICFNQAWTLLSYSHSPSKEPRWDYLTRKRFKPKGKDHLSPFISLFCHGSMSHLKLSCRNVEDPSKDIKDKTMRCEPLNTLKEPRLAWNCSSFFFLTFHQLIKGGLFSLIFNVKLFSISFYQQHCKFATTKEQNISCTHGCKGTIILLVQRQNHQNQEQHISPLKVRHTTYHETDYSMAFYFSFECINSH